MKKRILLSACLLSLCSLSGCGSSMQVPEPEQLTTPVYSVTAPAEVPSFQPLPEEIHTAGDGVTVIEPDKAAPDSDSTDEQVTGYGELTPDTVWSTDNTVTYHAFTLPDKAVLDEKSGCIGVLSIPAIDLTINVYEATDEMEAMRHGAAHYKETTAWDGNVGVSAHNGGVPLEVSFADLYKLKPGDTLTYKTALGERNYAVKDIREIGDEDWTWLSRTSDNRLTMTTCISGQPDKRLMVQAVQE